MSQTEKVRINKANEPKNVDVKVKRRPGRIEIGMIILTIVLLIVLSYKSIVLDEVKGLTPKEQQFKDFVDYSVQRDYDGVLQKTHLLVYRICRIETADKDQKAVLRYEDPSTGKMVEVIQEGRYKAEVRGYVLSVLPISQFSVTAEIQK